MACPAAQSESLDEGVETMSALTREEPLRQFHRTEDRSNETSPQPMKLLLHKTIVEVRIMRHQDATSQSPLQLTGHIDKPRGSLDHLITDTGMLADEGRDRSFRIDQGSPAVLWVCRIQSADADLDDPIASCADTGGFEIKKEETLQKDLFHVTVL